MVGSDVARQSRATPQAPPTLDTLVVARLVRSGSQHMAGLSLFVASFSQSTFIEPCAMADSCPPGSAVTGQGFKVTWVDVAFL